MKIEQKKKGEEEEITIT